MSVADNVINVPAGTYLITYTVNGSSGTATTLTTDIALNGTPLGTEALSVSAEANELVLLGKTILLTVGDASTISVVNQTANDVAVTNAGITVLKLQ